MDAEIIDTAPFTLRVCVPYWWSDAMVARWANQADMRMLIQGGAWDVQRREDCECVGHAHVVLAG